MRSFPILLTAATVGLATANAPADVVTITSTRTHTFCPVTQPITCPAGPTNTNVSPGSGNGGHGAGGQDANIGDVWASLWDNAKTEYNGQWDDWNNVRPTSTATTAAPSTTAGHGGYSTTGYSNGTTSVAWTSTSTGLWPSATVIKNDTDVCNDNLHRSKWCDDKSIDSDYYKNDYHTGVTRQYKFTITNTTMVFDGTGPKLAFAINGQVPGPVIEANWGDDIEVTFINQLQDNSTSIHFHGIRQEGTNDQDGVPGITECAIAGNGGSRTYKFHASSFGTSWYHSHMFAQTGDGIRGPIVIHGPATADYDYDLGTLMLDDTFTIPAAAQAARIAHFGPGGSFNTLFNGKNKSPDGKAGESFGWSVKPGKKHLFRIINSAAQNSFIVGFDKHTVTVIAADFIPIKPYKTDTVKIANGQRYDVILEADQAIDKYYVRAVLQTACPSGGANSGLGVANAVITYEGANSTAAPLSQTSITNVTAAICEDEPLASLVPYNVKPAGSLTTFQGSQSTIPGGALTSVATNDDGTVFQWFLNNAVINVDFHNPTLQTLASGSNNTISNAITLTKKNEWVYFVIQNQFFVSHPMHIHGHDVSVLGQGQGNFGSAQASSLRFDNPMRRDTVMLQGGAGPGQPTGYTVIGFETDNPGAWLMHCHIAWHLDGGLALQFIERPDDITASAFVGKQSFKDECSALTSYEATSPQGAKLSGQSGLKRRYEALDIEPFHAGAKMHIDKYRKRYAAHGHRH